MKKAEFISVQYNYLLHLDTGNKKMTASVDFKEVGGRFDATVLIGIWSKRYYLFLKPSIGTAKLFLDNTINKAGWMAAMR